MDTALFKILWRWASKRHQSCIHGNETADSLN
ncbi:MAG: hypothetical protein COB66_09290 [Coxiella sp. (in: Bacteria)]|nr:MAG: hypothetical protein COB66_09290 [Coxiella sp. (in: g-proteobacteria)]